MTRHENGSSIGCGGAHDLTQMHAGSGVEARSGLVEEQYFRVVHQSAGEAESLLLPAGKYAGGLVGELIEPDQREQFARTNNSALAAHPVEAGGGLEGGAHGKC